MKDYIDALTNANNDRELRPVSRDVFGMQGFNVGSFAGGWIARALLGKGVAGIFEGNTDSRRQRPGTFETATNPQRD